MTFQAASVPTSAASAGSASATLDSLAAVILCTAIVVGPLALGGTPAWACLGLEAAMATSAVLWAVARPRPVALLVIPLAIAALVLAQLVPLPDSVLTTIAPVSAGAWKVVHQGMPDAWGRISITPAASAAAARRLLLGITTILVVADVAHEPRRRRWLFTALAAVGGLVWLLAAVLPDDPKKPAVYGIYSLRGPIISWKTHERPPMQTTGVGEFDWVTVGEQRYRADGAIPGTAVGPYIYANHFANALCLTMPALCAIWLVYTRRRLPRPIALLGVVVVMGAALWGGFAWAASRAGTASLLFGCVVYLGLIVEARWLQWLLGGAATAGVLAIMGYMAVFQGPLARLVALGPAAWQPAVTAALQDGRMVAARIAGRMFLASPVLGTGLGSYGDLFPRFTGREWIFYFAHNDHAQLWAEAGLVGVVAWGLAAAVPRSPVGRRGRLGGTRGRRGPQRLRLEHARAGKRLARVRGGGPGHLERRAPGRPAAGVDPGFGAHHRGLRDRGRLGNGPARPRRAARSAARGPAAHAHGGPPGHVARGARPRRRAAHGGDRQGRGRTWLGGARLAAAGAPRTGPAPSRARGRRGSGGGSGAPVGRSPGRRLVPRGNAGEPGVPWPAGAGAAEVGRGRRCEDGGPHVLPVRGKRLPWIPWPFYQARHDAHGLQG
jgi:hypothetical protein